MYIIVCLFESGGLYTLIIYHAELRHSQRLFPSSSLTHVACHCVLCIETHTCCINQACERQQLPHQSAGGQRHQTKLRCGRGGGIVGVGGQ